jgi:hypothetical protein
MTDAPGMIAIVGTDGTRLVVWGLGRTEAEAREDAQEWLDQYAIDSGTPREDAGALTAHPCTARQADIIHAGDVSWPPRQVPCPIEL